MKIYNLPDLGEGLPDAIIREWYVKTGDTVTHDQPLAAMETAKALVDVPSPFDGTVEKLFGEPGDTIETGEPLIGFEGAGEAEEDAAPEAEATSAPSAPASSSSDRVKASPAVRAHAKKRGIDLATITPAGDRITKDDIDAAAQGTATPLGDNFQTLSPVRKAMVMSMTQSHKSVVPVTLMDDADIHAWTKGTDITVRLIRSIADGIKSEPILNATFDDANLAYALNEAINIGLAIDTPDGLFVPVLKDVGNKSDAELREDINRLKTLAQTKSLPPEDLHGATIMLSNFGTVAGRYANPILVPPMVAIVGIGKLREAVVAANGKPEVHKTLPLSVTVDHRAVTGGEVARFLGAMMASLEKV